MVIKTRKILPNKSRTVSIRQKSQVPQNNVTLTVNGQGKEMRFQQNQCSKDARGSHRGSHFPAAIPPLLRIVKFPGLPLL